MNWRRGLFRIWAVMAACWALFVIGLRLVNELRGVENDLTSLKFMLAFIVVPVVAVLIVGGAAVWAWRWIRAGFRK